jgi:restriction endonuclease Mrr
MMLEIFRQIFVEMLVINLLIKMGYGSSRRDAANIKFIVTY